MKLYELINVLGSGAWIRIGTEDGGGWVIYNKTNHVEGSHLYNLLKDRTVINVYDAEGRAETPYCNKLESGIAIIIEGAENGTI